MSIKKKAMWNVGLIAALLGLLFLLEQVLPSGSMLFTVLKKGAIYALVAVSMNLLNGFTGLFSLGQAGFMLLGAYTYAILTIPVESRHSVYQYFDGGIVQFAIPVPLALIAGGIVDKLGPLTNGSNLLRNFPSFRSVLYPFIVSGICIALIVMLINSTYGRAFKAIRDDEVAAEAMGINLAHHKRLAFVISSFFAGISGGLLAMYQTTIQASMFKSAMTYEILLIVVIGGIGSVTGSCISSFLFIACSEWWLRFLDNENLYIGSFHVPFLRPGFRKVVFAVVIMMMVLFYRKGIMGTKEFSVEGVSGFFQKKLGGKKAAKGGASHE